MHYFVTFGFGLLVFCLTRLVMIRRLEVVQKQVESVADDNSELLAEIDERNKDNLQTVISLTNLEARRVNRGLTTSHKAFADLQGRFGAMAIVQRALAHRRRAGAVPASPFLEEIIRNQTEGFENPLNYDIETNQLEIDVLLAGPLGLILHEISGQVVSRGALAKGRQIRLELSEENGIQLVDFNLSFSDESTDADADTDESTDADTDTPEHELSDDIIEMMSDQIAATLVRNQDSTQLQWRISYDIR